MKLTLQQTHLNFFIVSSKILCMAYSGAQGIWENIVLNKWPVILFGSVCIGYWYTVT